MDISDINALQQLDYVYKIKYYSVLSKKFSINVEYDNILLLSMKRSRDFVQ